jgi:hypothetical protein
MTGAFPVNMGGAARIPARTIAIKNEIEIETGTGTEAGIETTITAPEKGTGTGLITPTSPGMP